MAPTAVDIDSCYAGSLRKIAPKESANLSNRAFVLKEKNMFVFEDRPMPQLPSNKHVIVAIQATGLCGSDIHYWQHGQIGDFKVRQPLILGHESAGVVKQCGSSVRTLRPGDTVALEPGIPCRACIRCKEGRYNLCPDVEFAATPPHDGTLVGYYTVPEDFCYKLPKEVSVEEGALLEPLSVAVHCARLASICHGDAVLVTGIGPIGLLCCAVARAFGAREVIAVDVVPSRLEFALQYAATGVYQMEELAPEETAAKLSKTSGIEGGFDVVIDASGAQPCISTGIHTLRRGGKFVQAGLGAPEIAFPVAQLCAKEGTFVGSFRYGPGDYDIALELIKKEKVSVKELITHNYSFDEAEQAFQNVLSRQGIKTVIRGCGM